LDVSIYLDASRYYFFLEVMASISEAVYEESKILLEVWPFERSSSTPQ
jgi:hypothetical protein